MIRRLRIATLVLGLALWLAGALPAAAQSPAPGPVSSGVVPGPPLLEERGFRMGLGHGFARARVSSDGSDRARMDAALDLAASASELFLLEINPRIWFQEWEQFFLTPSLERRKTDFAVRYGTRGLRPILSMGCWQDRPTADRQGLRLVLPPGSTRRAGPLEPNFRTIWLQSVARIAREFRPPYLLAGTGLDRAEPDYDPGEEVAPDRRRADRRALLAEYAELMTRTRELLDRESPETRLIVGFDYDRMLARDEMGLVSGIDWPVDAIGFTVAAWRSREPNPDSDEDAEGIRDASADAERDLAKPTPPLPPDDYLEPLFAAAGERPVAILEFSWPARPGVPEDAARQAEYLRWFVERIRGRDVEFLHWHPLHDAPDYLISDLRQTRGLRESDGDAKPAWDAWAEIGRAPLAPRGD